MQPLQSQRDLAGATGHKHKSSGYFEHKYGLPLGANRSLEFTVTLTPRQVGQFESTITVNSEDEDSEGYIPWLEIED